MEGASEEVNGNPQPKEDLRTKWQETTLSAHIAIKPGTTHSNVGNELKTKGRARETTRKPTWQIRAGEKKASEPATFYLDSGCTQHMSDQRSFFTNFRPIAKLERPIDGIGGAKLYAHGIGDIAVSRKANGIKIDGWLRDVLYVPQLTVNLVSIGCITENGYMVVFSKDSAKIMQKDDTVMEGSRIGKTLYRLDISAKTPPITSLIASSSSATLNVWHERLSHVSHDIVKKITSSEWMSNP